MFLHTVLFNSYTALRQESFSLQFSPHLQALPLILFWPPFLYLKVLFLPKQTGRGFLCKDGCCWFSSPAVHAHQWWLTTSLLKAYEGILWLLRGQLFFQPDNIPEKVEILRIRVENSQIFWMTGNSNGACWTKIKPDTGHHHHLTSFMFWSPSCDVLSALHTEKSVSKT